MLRRTISYNMLWMVVFGGWWCVASDRLSAEEVTATRYEVALTTRFASEEHTQNNYVVVGIEYPGIEARRERDYSDIIGDFSFFFTPIPDDPSIPLALRRFYARSSTLHFSGTIEPEHTTSYTFTNPDIHYQTSSEDDEQLRQAGVDGVFYLFQDTGLRLRSVSAKDEQVSFETSPSVEISSRNEINEIRRDYGVGVVQYLSDSFALTIDYTYNDDELRSLEKSWQDNPLIFSEVARTTDTAGHAFSFGGEYIWQKRLGLQLAYQYFSYESDSHVQVVHLQNFAGDGSSFGDDGVQQTITPILRLYLGEKFMAQCDGGITWTAITRAYDNTTDVEYDWHWWQAGGGASYYFTRSFGVQAGYQYRARDGEIKMRSDGATRSTFDVDSEVQEMYLRITGRF